MFSETLGGLPDPRRTSVSLFPPFGPLVLGGEACMSAEDVSQGPEFPRSKF